MGNPFLVDDGQDTPDANHQALFDAIQKQTEISKQRQQLQNITPPNLSDQSQQQPGGVKKFFLSYLDQIGRNLSGRPTAFQEYQTNLKNQIAAQNAQSEGQLRQSQAKYYDDRNSTAENVANTKVSGVMAQTNAALSKHGYQMVMGSDGQPTMQAIPQGQLSEEAKSNISLNQARQEYQQAVSSKARADADVKMNPNNPTFLQKQKQIEAQLAMAQQKINLAVLGNQRQESQFQINNGVKPDGSPAQIQGAGQLLDDNGNPIGKSFQSLNGPTGSTKTAAEQGQIIRKAGTGLIANIAANRDKLGNMDAILNSAFMGTPMSDPKSAEIASEIASFAALNPRLHGFRGSQALAEFKKLVGANYNNPDAMIAGINGILKTADAVAATGIPKTNANRPTGNATHVYVPGKGIQAIGK